MPRAGTLSFVCRPMNMSRRPGNPSRHKCGEETESIVTLRPRANPATNHRLGPCGKRTLWVSGAATAIVDQKPSRHLLVASSPAHALAARRLAFRLERGLRFSLAAGNVRHIIELPTYLLDQRLAVGLDIERRAVNSPNDDPRFTGLLSVGLKASVNDLAHIIGKA
jgi:hypothetical protein